MRGVLPIARDELMASPSPIYLSSIIRRMRPAQQSTTTSSRWLLVYNPCGARGLVLAASEKGGRVRPMDPLWKGSFFLSAISPRPALRSHAMEYTFSFVRVQKYR